VVVDERWVSGPDHQPVAQDLPLAPPARAPPSPLDHHLDVLPTGPAADLARVASEGCRGRAGPPSACSEIAAAAWASLPMAARRVMHGPQVVLTRTNDAGCGVL